MTAKVLDMGLKSGLASLYFRIARWKMVVDCPLPDGGVLVGAPHTSKWDWALMMGIAAKTGMKLRWLGKQELFVGPLGPLLRAWGGVPVERSASHGLVDSMADALKQHPGTFVAITPEGTRSGPEYWKSGFYRIARKADVPLVLCFVDSKTRTTGIGEVIYPTGNVAADMDKIRAFFRGKEGIRPGNTKEPRLRDESQDAA